MIWSLQAVPHLSDTQFAQWSKLLEDRAGVYLSNQQRSLLQTQVSMRMRELGFSDYSAYYERVVDGVSGMVEWALLIDRLVVKETSFFRHKASIDFVGRRVAQHLSESGGNDSFDLWSVGCATGEEPYSLAMVINDAYQSAGVEPRFSVTGTDISRAALSLARNGVYSGRKLERLDETFRYRYFKEVGQGQFQVAAHIRDRLCFNHGNVLNINEMPTMTVDAIFCQNLLVYFRRWLREHILNAFVERLKPGGILIIGLGEVVDWSHPNLKRISADGVQAYAHK